MTKKILITGASGGFGKLIVFALLQKGHSVAASMRDINGKNKSIADELSKAGAKIIEIDVTDDTSVNNGVQKAIAELNGLDVLINNAGYYLSGLAEETTIEQGKQQFETNFWGTIKLTNALLPHFRKQRFGKIITVGSIMGLFNFPSAAYYGASKHALEGYFKSLRFELNEFNIKVAMVEPMGFKTGIISNSFAAEGKINEYDTYRNKIDKFSKELFENSPEPTPVINTLLKLIEDKNPTFSHPVGKGASTIWALQHFAYITFENSILKNINKFKN